MIDIGLTKIALIGVVALVVIGPEKLPRVARLAGTLFGRAQRYMSQVKAEVGREIELDELRKMQQEMRDAASEVQQDLEETGRTIHAAVSEAADAALEVSPFGAPTPERLAEKARNFRKKKLLRSSAIPSWYKRQSGHRTRVVSAAARVAKYRPASAGGKSSAFFH
ncbi:Sec-independent protein translocase protein TatB [Noviherbaspirillum sedimenti]|uniref:Sec-independent protein translocase protein TatB n=1 Tax=Noviherbaspirillum sedimenti TaxID=2320865 RepID=A0A3A3G1F7_9BURK|nr:Sec-independent protein translocase protein TatB [Noviherbaspirillum sedimenti]RJG02308.1 Sec-independent protein translocase subunit TatB [Noviherbaspirillum sedimenti]